MATVKFPIYLQFTKQKLCIAFGEPPYNIKTDKRITKKLLRESKPVICKPSPLKEAMKYAEMLKEPSIISKTQVAKKFGVSRTRVCQMFNLLDLNYNIIKYLLSTKNAKEVNYFTERRLRPLTCLSGEKQVERFGRMVQGVNLE